MKIENNRIFWYLTFFTFILDQISKSLSLHYLKFDHEIVINKYISLHRIYNEGTIMLSYHLPFGLTDSQFKFFWLLFAVTLGVGIHWLIHQKGLQEAHLVAKLSKLGIFLLLGGIWGNAFDRIFRPEGVIDFIRLNMFENIIPIVNFADIIIYVGNFVLLSSWIVYLFNYFRVKINLDKKNRIME